MEATGKSQRPAAGGATPGKPVTDVSPEARRRVAVSHPEELPPKWRARPDEIVRRVAIGTWNDGFIHAGNLAYMSMLAIFPFFILGSAAFSLIGDQNDRAASVGAVLAALPPSVADVIGPAARAAIEARTGWLLWVGSVVALWTVSSLIETVRDILRRAYGTKHTAGFLWHRLGSTGLVIAATVLLLLALLAQVTIGTAQEAIEAWSPQLAGAVGTLSLSRAVPTVVAFFSIYLLFYSLAPAAYRTRRYPKWPGALAVTTWWVTVSLVFPPLIHHMFSYSLTYGSLAGIMIALFFFWLIGLGVVVGAELNAALAHTPEEDEAREMTETDREGAVR
ncbi:MAG TPA: YihY/virulence factor BrkB family protein [Sphingomonadaceae bacterium]